jgi:hypothetical protein
MRRLLALLLLTAACDKPAPPPAPEAAAPPPPVSASAVPTVAESASAAPPAASASAGASTKDITLSVLDPATDKEKTVKVPVGGSVTVWLPEYAGSSWSVQGADKTLGKAKEQTIPGFAGPSTPAHEFKWKIDGPLLKAGQSHKVQIGNVAKGGGGKPGTTFTLTIDIV